MRWSGAKVWAFVIAIIVYLWLMVLAVGSYTRLTGGWGLFAFFTFFVGTIAAILLLVAIANTERRWRKRKGGHVGGHLEPYPSFDITDWPHREPRDCRRRKRDKCDKSNDCEPRDKCEDSVERCESVKEDCHERRKPKRDCDNDSNHFPDWE